MIAAYFAQSVRFTSFVQRLTKLYTDQTGFWGSPVLMFETCASHAALPRIQATHFGGSFAALKHDGTVVTWGIPHSGGDCSSVQDDLRNVQSTQVSRGTTVAGGPVGRNPKKHPMVGSWWVPRCCPPMIS